MKAKVLIVGIIALTLVACNKDLFTTNPQLTFTSVSSTTIPFNGYIDFKLQATDKQGDIQDSLWMKRISYTSDCVSQDSTLSYSMPQFTGSTDLKATIDLAFSVGGVAGNYVDLSPCIVGNPPVAIQDSCYYKFWIKDNAGHVSDTISSPTLIFLHQ